MKAGGAPQRIGVPRVVTAGRQHAADVGRCGDAHAGPHVAEVARVLEQHHGRRARIGEHGGEVHGGALGQAHHAGARRERRELVEDRGLDAADEGVQALAQIGGEPRGEAVELGRIRRDGLEHVRAEAQRVLEGMEAFEHRQRGVAPRAAEARDERSILH